PLSSLFVRDASILSCNRVARWVRAPPEACPAAIRERIRRKENLMSRLRTVCLVAVALPLFAQRPPAAESPAPPAAEEKPAPIPSETTSVTDHELQLDGKTIHYKATAATLLIDGEDEKPYGIVFYVAYTLSGVSDPRTRPVTFLYNGGPGSA